jgi:O-antigen ligase
MFVVSLKFLLAKMWYIVAVYFVASQFFKRKKNILTFFWLYLIPLAGVAIYTFIHHSTYGFAERPAHWVMQPFFKDHTVYGAVLAMMFPIMICLFALKRYRHYRLITLIMLIALALGIVFSYGRAAWISLVVALLVSFIYFFKLRGSFVLSVAGLFIIITGIFWYNIIDVLEENKQDSTSENLTEHVQSISNISTDASNLERINRWKSAYRMFEKKPIFGWGPGTYMFQYAPFQSSEDLTIISTNSADGGNAHSEFLGPLSESGIIGTLSFILIIVVFYRTASRLYWILPQGELRTIVFFVILAFTTYMVNGTLNNFLDTDKASIPFWGFIAIIMSIDLHYKKMLKLESQQQES